MLHIIAKIGPDKTGLILTTSNLIHGHGITVNNASLQDLAQTMYVPFYGWPPGYHILLAPFLWVFENNFMLAAFLLDCSITILFFIYLRKLILHIGFPVWAANVFLLFLGFWVRPKLLANSPTDFIGMTFMLAGIYHLIRLTGFSAFSRKHVGGIAFFFTAAALIRYQYIPVTVVLLLALVGQGLVQKARTWSRSGIIALSILVAIVSSVLLYQKYTSGAYTYIAPAKEGFFPGNLLKMYPFIVASFIDIPLYAMQVHQLFNVPYNIFPYILSWTSIAIFAVLTLLFITQVVFSKANAHKPDNCFRYFGGLASLLTAGLLMLLSLSRSGDVGPPMFHWTYVSEERYFALTSLVILIVTWQWLWGNAGNGILKKVLAAMVIITASIEVLHGAYYVTKNLLLPKTALSEKLWQRPAIGYVKKFIEEEQGSSNRNIVVTSTVKQFGFTAALLGEAGMFNPLQLNQTMPKSSSPAVLLVVIEDKELPYYQSFLQKPGVEMVHTEANYYFYTIYVDPGPIR